jgi:hypothetical protein
MYYKKENEKLHAILSALLKVDDVKYIHDTIKMLINIK